MTGGIRNPFVLSLSKHCHYLIRRAEEGQHFDKLSANGGWASRS